MISFYNRSVVAALENVFPDIGIDKHKFMAQVSIVLYVLCF